MGRNGPVTADFPVTPVTSFLHRVPGLLSWVVILVSVAGPFLYPLSFLIWASLYALWFMGSIAPTAVGLARTCWKIRAQQAKPTPEPCAEGQPHAFVLCTYKDDVSLLRRTLDLLAGHVGADKKYVVVLALEARADESEKARQLVSEYSSKFLAMSFNEHVDAPGECRGKASNACSAGRYLSKLVGALGLAQNEVLVTVMDSDIEVYEEYIARLEENVTQVKKGNIHRTLFCPYMTFYNTEGDASVPAGVAQWDVLWAAAVIGNMGRNPWLYNVKFPCSTYSISLETLVEMGFWEVGDVGIGEDHHTALRLFFSFPHEADFQVIHAPFGASSVGADGVVAGIRARVTQAQRHYLAQMDISYVCYRAYQQWRDFHVWQLWGLVLEVSGHFLHLTLSLPITSLGLGILGLWYVLMDSCAPSPWQEADWCEVEYIFGYQWKTVVQVWLLVLSTCLQGVLIASTLVMLPCAEYCNFAHHKGRTIKEYVCGALRRYVLGGPYMLLFTFPPALMATTKLLMGHGVVYKSADKSHLKPMDLLGPACPVSPVREVKPPVLLVADDKAELVRSVDHTV
mmetsp:Transcript_18208/g.40184  ORF Transcript_18208/g.40184 Transcript_18208/m.40184 type:complete len:569 (+) Transcript_18208:55-1761(+)|eukprot:CAMPEP_0204391388 /NCGR_PEP_ID=MMETSP0469-20131031/61220_1 /ASSEMBLY_ACC=CAM_ASM_000384 /TAXON_ID=2969 /ORGANISM="Oxyrrhis marina" /LENGTH=568 /DNA_ID=CAMNT_0051385343 /DNA_START=52 /DNA_END=1758 /DNA_ORIENTATION=-